MSHAPQVIQYCGYTYRRAERRTRITPEYWRGRIQEMFRLLKQPAPKRIAVDLGVTPQYPLADVTMTDKETAASVYRFLRRRGWTQVELRDAVLKLKLNPDWPMIA